MTEATYMQRALELANLSDGSVAPRPPVGCVIVTPDGETFEGRTKRKPGPHAEAEALTAAGSKARGATAYVTLEPCCVAVSKPVSCAQLLIEAGVSRVVASMSDPCPDIDGRGFAMLRDAGIDVETGLLQDEARALIEPFAKWIATREPFVTLKLAASLDGKVAAPDGTSRWITGEAARAEVHDLRRRADAVVVGSGTVIADDPMLTFRTPGLDGDQPLRVVLDSSGRTPRGANVFNNDASTLVITADDVGRSEAGVDVRAAMHLLGERDVCHVLVEAGPRLAASFMDAGLVDRFVLYLAPKVIGGDAPGLFAHGVKTLTDAYALDIVGVTRVGDDIRIEARP